MDVRRVAVLASACLLLLCGCLLESQQTGRLQGAVVSGPTCPAEPDDAPPSGGCRDQPVTGADIVERPRGGGADVTASTDQKGVYEVELPPGEYLVVPQDVPGLLGTPEPAEVTVVADQTTTAPPLRYDTGVR